ncbi:MAG: NAD(P)H-hydrate dehydratase [Deltaproteobacteria bacterium]|nr:NAD(P)H-hydrate dehydratase [Deltaproteobacteria bacterium]
MIGRPLLSRASARAADRALIGAGVLGIVLMENAGRAATDVIVREMATHLARPLIVGGLGQNGGDAWVVARQLRSRGVTSDVVLVGDPAKVAGDAAIALASLRAIGLTPFTIERVEQLDALRDRASLLIDGLFGTGLDRPLEGLVRDVIEQLDTWTVPRVALDLPSGVCADTGRVLGAALRADLTITLHAHKRGLHHAPGVSVAGRVVVADIGAPAPVESEATLVGAAELAAHTHARAIDAHKGTGGHVLVIAGSPGKTGAALLSGLGAMRAGAGLVTLATRGAARAALDAKVIELMTREVPEALEAGVGTVLADAARCASAVLGPGLGLDDATRAFVRRLILELPIPTVLDADALRAIADHGSLDTLVRCAAPRVLTPHPAEAAALLGTTTEIIQSDRFAAASRLASVSRQCVVLKGARTIVARADGTFVVCDRGTPALGVAGTGDVLSGVIAGLLAETRAATPSTTFDHAWRGVVAHAIAGERGANGRDRGLLASEVAEAVSLVMGDAVRDGARRAMSRRA